MFLSLHSKNLKAKIKINVLLNFSQMFNMQALGYMAHIETVFHFLSNSNKHIGINDYQGLVAALKTLFKIYVEHMSMSFIKFQNTKQFLLFRKRHFKEIRGKLMEMIF